MTIKTIPLTIANLKGFLRDWKYVTVLIGLPLVIVGMIFGSLGYDSINLPMGTINNAEGFDYNEFEREAVDWAEITQYGDLEACLEDLTEYEVYGCIKFENNTGEDRYQVNIYYDNTNNRVGSRIRAEVKQIASSLNLNYSEERANDTLENITEEKEKLIDVRSNFTEFDNTLDAKVEFLDSKIKDLKNNKKDLENEAAELRQIQEESRDILEEINQSSSKLSDGASVSLREAGLNLEEMENLSAQNRQRKLEALNQIKDTNDSLQTYKKDLNSQLDRYQGLYGKEESISDKEEQYTNRLEDTISQLQDSRNDLQDVRDSLQDINKTLDNSLSFYEDLEDLNASRVATSVSVDQRGLYRTEETEIYNIDVGEPGHLNLLRLQTIYSTVLVFISLFISILVSEFITVEHINSDTVKRLKMVENISFAEYISVFISSLLIVSVPMITVILFGQYMFELPIFQNILQTTLIVGLLCAAIVNIGIAVAYLVKEKSITLLIGNLLLVLFSFFSGFILPLEFMRPVFGGLGSIQPASLARKAFDLVILYNQPLQDIQLELYGITAWILGLGVVAFKIKEYKQV